MTLLLGLLAGLLLVTTRPSVSAQKYEGETCTTDTNAFGECKRIASCDSARLAIQRGKRPEICSYDKEVPIVCCADPNILSAPEPAGSAPLWPSEAVASQRPAQRPPPGPPPTAPSGPPTQRPAQRPPTGPPVTAPSGPPTQRPAQRPAQRPTPRPPPGPPPTASSGPPAQPAKRPQWWQIPTRKRTESPPVIDNLATTPISGVGNNQLPPRLQGATEPPTRTEEAERIVFSQNQRI